MVETTMALTRGERYLREQLDIGLLHNSDIPPKRTRKFFESADLNRDNRVTYDEFVRQVMFEDSTFRRRLTSGKRSLNRAVFAIDPISARRCQRMQLHKSGVDETDVYNWGEADIIVFIYYAIIHALDDNPYNDVTASSGVPYNSPLIYLPTKRYECWRFVSYMFIHNGYVHLVFNCLMQLVLGTLLELVHKFWRVGIVYLLGVLGGSLAHSVSDPFVALAGASGGCYALIGAHVASIIINWQTMQAGWLKNPVNFLSSGAVRLFLIIFLAGGDTALAVYSRFSNPDQSTQIGFVAHLGGFIAGVLVGVPVLRNLEVERWEKVCFWICIFLYAAFMAAAVLFNGFCEPPGWCPPTNWD